jgi:hypothetical protein
MLIMTALSRDEVITILGPVDDLVLAQIIGMGATAHELAEARAWTANDEPLVNAGRPLAEGRVVRLIDLIRELEKDEEELATHGPR